MARKKTVYEKDSPAIEETKTLKLTKKNPDEETAGIPVWEDRKKQWKDNESVQKELGDMYSLICSGFDDKTEQTQMIEEAWQCYNCETNAGQAYQGRSQIYLSIIRDAVEARVTRFTNSLFPKTGRYTEVVSADGKVPFETMSICDHYVEAAKLREDVIPSLVRSGDMSGQFSVEVNWVNRKKFTVKKVESPLLEIEGAGTPSMGTTSDIEIEEVDDGAPEVSVVDPRDLLILPASVDRIEDADVVAVSVRMSKGRIQEMIDSGEFDEESGEELLDNMAATNKKTSDSSKENLSAAGVKVDSKGNKTALIYKVWTKLKLNGKRRMCLSYIAGADNVLSCKRNPYWCDEINIITQPALKVNGSIWGKSRVSCVTKAQYAANDAFNMGLDSANFSLMPIIAVDPEKNPRSGTIVLTMGAVWQVDPNSMKMMQFPPLWRDAMALVSVAESRVMSSLSTNPAMMSMGSGGKRPTAAQIAQEQQVALEGTADVVTILEQGILNKVLKMFYEFDYQFRSRDITVKRFGTEGLQSELQSIPPSQVGSQYSFRWYGTEGNRSAQEIQQMISTMNVLNQIPPQQLNGLKINMAPVVEHIANTVYGPKLGPKVVVDQRHQLSVPASVEGDMLSNNFYVAVSPSDNDVEHISAHTQRMNETGDPTGQIRIHIAEHQIQLNNKNQQALMEQMQQSPDMGGNPGGPRPGGQAEMPTGPQQPAGAVRQDEMSLGMPRLRGQ